jgi:hypothetical protein
MTNITDDAWDWMDPDNHDNPDDEDEDDPNDEYCPEED